MRYRYFDLLRALAIIRVVIYHALGWAWLTVLFPAMGIMFALAGSLMAKSLDKSGTSAIWRRMRRLLPPLWALGVVMVPAMALSGWRGHWQLLWWILPLEDPPMNSWGSIALGPLWYLRQYLWFLLLSPLALRAFRRWPVRTTLAPLVLLGLLVIARDHGGVKPAPILWDLGLYGTCWLLGFAHNDGILRRMSRPLLLGVAGVSAAVGAAWFLTHPSVRGYDLNDIPVGQALWSAAFVMVALGFTPSVAWVDRWQWSRRLVDVLNGRAVTVYLWHMPAIFAVGAVATALSMPLTGVVGALVQLSVVAGLIAVAVAAFGWVEDLAGGRRPALIPAPRVPVPTVVATRRTAFTAAS